MSVTALDHSRSDELAGLVASGLITQGLHGPGLVGRASGRAVRAGADQVFPLLAELRTVSPWPGLRRGATVAVDTDTRPGSAVTGAAGSTSLCLALLVEAARAGSWCGVVGVPELGAAAAAESGIELGRLALVPDPGPEWVTVVAALLDGLDIVVVRPPGPVTAPLARRLAARARQRGSVLISYGSWAGAEFTLRVAGQRWHGLEAGRGRLRARELTVVGAGRGAATRPREVRMWWPPAAPDATAPTPVETNPTVIPMAVPVAGSATVIPMAGAAAGPAVSAVANSAAGPEELGEVAAEAVVEVAS